MKDVKEIMNTLSESTSETFKVSFLNRPYLFFNSKAEIIEYNKTAQEILKLRRAELLALNLFSVKKNKYFIEKLLSALANGIDVYTGGLYQTETDILIRANFIFLPVRSGNNKHKGILCFISEIGFPGESISFASDQGKYPENVNYENPDFLSIVINAISIPFFVKDEDHRWVMMNDAMVSMMGKPHAYLLGKSDYDVFPREQADVFWEKDEYVFKFGNNINEEKITWNDGNIHSIVTSKQLYTEKDTGKKFIVGTILDITEIKQKEEELWASERKYHELFDNANDFIATSDQDGNITEANLKWLEYLKTDLEQLRKKNLFDFIKPKDIEKAKNLLDCVLKKGEITEPLEFEADINGESRFFEIKVSLIPEHGVLPGIIFIFRDITEKLNIQQQLVRYNQELTNLNETRDKFFSIIAHDLRAPYSSLIGFTELLMEDLDKLERSEVRDYLRIIRNSAKNSFNLLENLLAWSRLQTGRMPYDPQKMNLWNVVEDVVSVLYSLAYRKKIEISNLVSPAIELLADKNMINTIIHNLLMNAIKYSPIGGSVSLAAIDVEQGSEYGSKPCIAISVSDNGIGMEKEVLDNLFSSDKVPLPGTEKEQGTGLGLLISREMVERHGGIITIESNPGKGAIFTFTVPAFVSGENSET